MRYSRKMMNQNENKINILFLVHKFDIGGVQKVNVQLIKLIDKDKFNVHVLYIKDGAFKEKVESDKIEINKIGNKLKLYSPINLLYIYKTIKYIKRHKIDLVCSIDQVMYIIGSISSKLAGAKHIRFQPNFIRKFEKLNSKTLKYLPFEKWTDLFICFNKATKSDLIKAGVSEKKIEIIYSFTELIDDKINIDNDIRAEFNIPSNKKIVCSIGRLVEGKGFDIFLRIIHQINASYSKIHFFVIGDGPLKDELIEMSKKLKITNITFTGFRSDIEKIIPQINIGIYPNSDSAGMINVAIGGKVLISNKSDIMSEYIQDGETGFLIDSFNVVEYANKVISLLSDNELLRKMEIETKRFYSNKFDGTKNIKIFESLVFKILSRKCQFDRK